MVKSSIIQYICHASLSLVSVSFFVWCAKVFNPPIKFVTHLSVLSKIVKAIFKESSTSVFLLADLRFYTFNSASCLLWTNSGFRKFRSYWNRKSCWNRIEERSTVGWVVRLQLKGWLFKSHEVLVISSRGFR